MITYSNSHISRSTRTLYINAYTLVCLPYLVSASLQMCLQMFLLHISLHFPSKLCAENLCIYVRLQSAVVIKSPMVMTNSDGFNTLHNFLLINHHSLVIVIAPANMNWIKNKERNNNENETIFHLQLYLVRLIRFDHHWRINSSLVTVFFGATHIWI